GCPPSNFKVRVAFSPTETVSRSSVTVNVAADTEKNEIQIEAVKTINHQSLGRPGFRAEKLICAGSSGITVSAYLCLSGMIEASFAWRTFYGQQRQKFVRRNLMTPKDSFWRKPESLRSGRQSYVFSLRRLARSGSL